MKYRQKVHSVIDLMAPVAPVTICNHLRRQSCNCVLFIIVAVSQECIEGLNYGTRHWWKHGNRCFPQTRMRFTLHESGTNPALALKGPAIFITIRYAAFSLE